MFKMRVCVTSWYQRTCTYRSDRDSIVAVLASYEIVDIFNRLCCC